MLTVSPALSLTTGFELPTTINLVELPAAMPSSPPPPPPPPPEWVRATLNSVVKTPNF